MNQSTRSPSKPWPVWLLLFAWACANSPHQAVFSALTWLEHAHSFSHQTRLKSQVASLLAGADLPAFPGHVAPTPSPKDKKPAPASEIARRIELATEPVLEVTPLAPRVQRWAPEPRLRLAAVALTPPHEPPRHGRT